MPFLMVIVLIASAIFAFIIDNIPSANSTFVIDSFFAIFLITFSELVESNCIHPPSFESDPILPKNKFASVTVGSKPPLP